MHDFAALHSRVMSTDANTSPVGARDGVGHGGSHPHLVNEMIHAMLDGKEHQSATIPGSAGEQIFQSDDEKLSTSGDFIAQRSSLSTQ